MVYLHVDLCHHLFVAHKQPRNSVLFDCSATYQIRVQGKISPPWSDRLEGMRISQDVQGDGSLITTLEGELSDQAALVGVLNSLYELHLTVLFVDRL